MSPVLHRGLDLTQTGQYGQYSQYGLIRCDQGPNILKEWGSVALDATAILPLRFSAINCATAPKRTEQTDTGTLVVRAHRAHLDPPPAVDDGYSANSRASEDFGNNRPYSACSEQSDLFFEKAVHRLFTYEHFFSDKYIHKAILSHFLHKAIQIYCRGPIFVIYIMYYIRCGFLGGGSHAENVRY